MEWYWIVLISLYVFIGLTDFLGWITVERFEKTKTNHLYFNLRIRIGMLKYIVLFINVLLGISWIIIYPLVLLDDLRRLIEYKKEAVK